METTMKTVTLSFAAGILVEWIRGSWSNVVGLPLEAFYGMLKRTGYRF